MQEPARNTKTMVVAGLGLIALGGLLAFVTGVFPARVTLVLAGTASAVLLYQALLALREAGLAERQAVMMRQVFAASESILSSLDVTHVLRSAAEAAARLSWHTGASLLYVADESKIEVRSSSGFDLPPDPNARFPVLDSYLAEAQKTRRSAFTALPDRSEGLEGFRSACVLPLQHKGGVVGALVLLSAKPPGTFSQELGMLEYFANQAAVAIDNARLYHHVQELFLSTIKALAAAVDAKDAYTHGHSEDIATLVDMIAREMKLPPREQEKAKLAGLLHDVGKIGIPDAILRKPGRLDASERAVMMSHATLGAEIIDKPGPLQELVAIVRHHHERYDGKGYPEGLAGRQIPIGAAILAVADAFDAMTSHRAYHSARPLAEALEELQRNAGTQFNPDVVDALARVIDQERAAGSGWYTALERRIHDYGGGQVPTPTDAPAGTEAGIAMGLAQELRHITDLRTLLDRLVTLAPDALGVDEVAILLADDREQELTVEAMRDTAAPAGITALRKGQTIARGKLPAWRAIDQNAAQLNSDGRTIYAPLIAGGRAFGVLEVAGAALRPAHLRLITAAADAVAPLIQATRLTQRARSEEEKDALTGLLNRPAMLHRLKEEASRYQRHGTPYAIALGTVRDLPQFNATHGFGAGDELIKRIATLFQDNTRASDVVARISGGTFAIVMPDVGTAGAQRGVRRLEALFADRQVPVKGQFVQCPAFSWVVASCPKDAAEPDALFAHAERRVITHHT